MNDLATVNTFESPVEERKLFSSIIFIYNTKIIKEKIWRRQFRKEEIILRSKII